MVRKKTRHRYEGGRGDGVSKEVSHDSKKNSKGIFCMAGS